jgi:FkbM family methyltransferase
MKSVHGWAFPDADEFMAQELHEDGGYQASHLRMALAHVTEWSLAIDGGAHAGTWTKPMAERFASVIAVEPSPDTYEALAENMRRFGIANVDLRNVAIGASAGTVSMVLDGRGADLKNTGARYIGDGGTIPRVTIDSWDLSTLGFLKLDIEGSEVDALAGASETLKRCRPIVLFENKGFWRRFGYEKDAPQVLWTSLGYRFLEKAGCDQIWGAA